MDSLQMTSVSRRQERCLLAGSARRLLKTQATEIEGDAFVLIPAWKGVDCRSDKNQNQSTQTRLLTTKLSSREYLS
eukprot:scaffold18647_cov94-Skeletonema_dohrnii-CCMP3373.AAC.1